VNFTYQLIGIPKPPTAIHLIFTNKDEIPQVFQSNEVYWLRYTSCSAKYIEKIVRSESL
jgi:hypothetical protein